MGDLKKEDQEKPERGIQRDRVPAEGPHAREDLIDREKTPGTGSLPGPNGEESDVGPD